MNKNSVGTRKMRREDYKKVKKMDRQQFESFCRCLYEEGQQAVHNCEQTRILLCRIAQQEFEQTHTRDEWMRLFKRNYL